MRRMKRTKAILFNFWWHNRRVVGRNIMLRGLLLMRRRVGQAGLRVGIFMNFPNILSGPMMPPGQTAIDRSISLPPSTALHCATPSLMMKGGRDGAGERTFASHIAQNTSQIGFAAMKRNPLRTRSLMMRWAIRRRGLTCSWVTSPRPVERG